MSKTPKTPSTILSDALTAFNRAATLAFTTAQDQARRDVGQASMDAREARRERDEAVSALHAHTLEEQAWKQEANEWKAAVNQAELAIHHHLETIAQLRQEAAQWKNQCLRLEETSRQEAISWKEQFLRVEQERSKLAQRVEELVAEKLASGGHAQTAATSYTPLPRYSAIGDISASTRLQRASALDSSSPSLLERPPPKLQSSLSRTIPSSNQGRSNSTLQLPTPLSKNQQNTRQRIAQDAASLIPQGSTSSGTRQIVLRRVHAVVEVPVKEESLDRDVGIGTLTSSTATNTAPASSSSGPKPVLGSHVSRPPPLKELSNATPRAKRKVSVKRAYVEIDDEESERERESARQDSKQSDSEYQPVSDGDDELLMGIEANRKEVYAMKHIPKLISPQKSIRTPTVVKKRKTSASSAKKNRLSASTKS